MDASPRPPGGITVTASFDLDVDTELLRRSASTMSEAGRDFIDAGRSITSPFGQPLGTTATALALSELLDRSVERCAGAAAQLGGISIAVAEHLQSSAAHFEHADAALRPHHR